MELDQTTLKHRQLGNVAVKALCISSLEGLRKPDFFSPAGLTLTDARQVIVATRVAHLDGAQVHQKVCTEIMNSINAHSG